MLFSLLNTTALLGVLLISNARAQSSFDEITDPSKRAELALSSLMQWYDADSGLWETTGWWNAANIITMIGNHAKTDENNVYLQTLARTVFSVAAQNAPTKNPNPDAERHSNSSSKMVEPGPPGTGYYKFIDSTTHALDTYYPGNWSISKGRHVNITDLALQIDDDPRFAAFTPDPKDFLDGYYDDDLWWALAWINAYDVTNHEPYLTLAEGIFSAVTKAWPTKCNNGGIYWNTTSRYVNAISNELFFSTAAHLANRAGDEDYYATWAKRSLSWFLGSGMMNKNGTINDGLDDSCRNNNGTVWSYNQGVILGGLVEMFHYSREKSHLGLALRIAYAALDVLLADGFPEVLRDPCERYNCGADGTQFKGIFMRSCLELWRVTEDKLLEHIIRSNAYSIWKYARHVDEEGRVLFEVHWDEFTGIANASTQSSAMEALVADIWVYRCWKPEEDSSEESSSEESSSETD